MKGFFGIVFFLLSFSACWSQSLLVGNIRGNGNFDELDLRDSFKCFMTQNEVVNVTHWSPPGDVYLVSQEERRSTPIVELSYRYGLGVSANGQSGSAGYGPYSAGGSSAKERQESILLLRVMVNDPGGHLLCGFQVNAAVGEDYPRYQHGGISTPWFHFENWSYNNGGNLAQLVGQQRLIAIANAKAIIKLAEWWIDPASAQYHHAPQTILATPPSDCRGVQYGQGGQSGVRTVFNLTKEEWRYFLRHPRARVQYVVERSGVEVVAEEIDNPQFKDGQVIFYKQFRDRSKERFRIR